MEQQDDKLKALYDNVSKEYNLPDYKTFVEDMADETKRKKMYDTISKDYSLPDYNTFSTDMGLKKKEQTQVGIPFSQQPLPVGISEAPSTESHLPSNLNEAAKPTTVITEPKQKIDDIVKPKQDNVTQTVEWSGGVSTQAPRTEAERTEKSKENSDRKEELSANVIDQLKNTGGNSTDAGLLTYNNYKAESDKKSKDLTESIIAEKSIIEKQLNEKAQARLEANPEYKKLIQDEQNKVMDIGKKMVASGVPKDIAVKQLQDHLTKNINSNPAIQAIRSKENEAIDTEYKDWLKNKIGSQTTYFKDGLPQLYKDVIKSKSFLESSNDDKRYLVTQMWGGLEKKFLENKKMTAKQIADAKHDFYYKAMEEVSYNEDGQLTPIAIKDYATQNLPILQKLEKQTTDEYEKLQSSVGIDAQVKKYNELKDIEQARKNLDEIVNMPDNAHGSFVKGLKDGTSVPFASSYFEILNNLNLYDVTQKTKAGKPLTDAEQTLLATQGLSSTINSQTKPSTWYNVGQTTAASMVFMAELTATAGTNEAAMKGVEKMVMGDIMKTAGESAVNSARYQFVYKPLSGILGASAQTMANPQMYLKNITQRIQPSYSVAYSPEGDKLVAALDWNTKNIDGTNTGTGESIGTATLRGVGNAFSDIFSESVFHALPSITDPVKRNILKSMTQNSEFAKRTFIGWYMAKEGLSTGGALARLRKAGMPIDGLVDEMLENIVNDGMTNLLTGDARVSNALLKDDGSLDIQKLKENAYSTAITVGALGLLGSAMNHAPKKKYVVNTKDVNGHASNLNVSENTVSFIASNLKDKSFGEVKQWAKQNIGRVKPEEREAAMAIVNGYAGKPIFLSANIAMQSWVKDINKKFEALPKDDVSNAGLDFTHTVTQTGNPPVVTVEVPDGHITMVDDLPAFVLANKDDIASGAINITIDNATPEMKMIVNSAINGSEQELKDAIAQYAPKAASTDEAATDIKSDKPSIFGTFDDMKGKTIQQVSNSIDEAVVKHDEAILPLQEEVAALKKKPKTKENTALIAEKQKAIDKMQVDYEDQQFEHSQEIMRGIKAEADAKGIELSEDDVQNIHDDLVTSLFDEHGRESVWNENFDDVLNGLLKPYEATSAQENSTSVGKKEEGAQVSQGDGELQIGDHVTYNGEPMTVDKFSNPVTARLVNNKGDITEVNINHPELKYSAKPEAVTEGNNNANTSQDDKDETPDFEKSNDVGLGAETTKKKSVIDEDDELKNLFNEFRKEGGFNTNAFAGATDPKLIGIIIKIMKRFMELGIHKLEDVAKQIYSKFGEPFLREAWDYIKNAYTSAYNESPKEKRALMDKQDDVLDFDLEKFINDIKQEEDGKSGTTTESSVGKNGKDVVAGQSQSDVSKPADKQEAGSVDNTEGGESDSDKGHVSGQGAASEPSGGDGTGGVDLTLNGNEDVNKELGGTSVTQPMPKPSESTPVVSQTRHNGNFVIPPNFAGQSSFSVSKKLDDNINALKILITLKNENRVATPSEQDQLFKYVGWGGIKEIGFDPNSDGGWSASNAGLKQRIGQVHDLLKELDPKNYKENIATIKGSVLNAHYTAIPVIRGIYNVLRYAGFKGGATLEPSAGIGHFIGAMPIDMLNNSKITAIEKDNITAEILRALYPNIISRNDGYEKVNIAKGAADLVISNIPFGTYSVFDPNFSKSKIQAIRQSTSKIHSYFFARALQDVKPGGLIAIVTTAGVLDSPSNADLRKHIAKSAEFMGAIRLPNNTFKGNANTEVVTDIIFLRKFNEDEKPAQPHKFIDSKTATVNHKDKKTETKEISYNQYFHKNPNMVLGKFEAGGLQTDDQMTVTSTGIDLEKGISDLAEKIFNKKIESGNNNSEKEIENHYVKNNGQRNGNIVEVKPGVFGVITDEQAIDGNLDQKARDVNVSPDRVREGNATENDIANLAEVGLRVGDFDIKQVNKISIPKKYAGAIHDMISIRNALNHVYASELGDYTDDAIAHRKSQLKTAYDNFVKAHGTILQNKALFELDSDGHNMMALEHVEDKKVVGLADIFTKRVFEKAKRATSAANISEAVAINLNETGGVDIGRVADLLGVSKDEAIKLGKGIIFKNPKGGFEDNTKYLSGNVRQKLNEAKLAAKEDPFYDDNVTALEAVQPPPLNASQIYAPISAPWIDIKHYMDFASQLFQQDVKITRLSTGSLNVIGSDNNNTQVTDAYGTPKMNGFDLLEEVMQNRIPLVKRTIEDENGRKTTVIDEEATANAIDKAEKIKREFDKWIWKDDKRRNELVDYYNDNFNGTIVPKNDGSHLTFPGYIGHNLRPHQKDGIWMIIQQMNGILDHVVGSGKSLIMVVAAMKMKQMGMIKKPIILGLKANTSDLAKTFKDSYPMAKVLSPKEKDFSPENRKAFFAKMANNDWDAIIMTHDQFGMIQQSADIQQEIIQQEIDALEEDILAAKNNDLSKRELNGLETRKLNLETKLQNAALMKKDLSLKSFEEMGIDFMFVDESQQFKNLTYNTIQRGVAGLGDPKGSTKAFNLLFAARTLQKFYSADKGTVFASGTPISNTMVEMYLLFKYLRPNKMEELGINSFDNWANTFASVGSEIEFGVTNSLKPKTRMRNFMNVPEMATMYREIADVRNEKNLKLPRPEFKKTFRVKTSKDIAKNETIFIGGNKYRVIGGMKGLSKNEHWLSLSSVGKDIQPAKSGSFEYENESTPYTDSEGVNGLLVNVSPTKEQRRFGKKIQEFAKTKDGRHIGRSLTDKQKKAYMLLATNLASKMAIDMRLVDPSYADSEVGKLGVAADTILEHYKDSDKHKGLQLVFSDIGTPKSANPSINLFDLLESRGIDNDTLLSIFGAGAFSETPRFPPIKDVRKRIAATLEYSDEQIDDAITESNETTFNIYQSIKDKLVKRGIPANEIAFIHDYNTSSKKEQLFNDARSGKVRVIIGSTSKLGTGVNIQNRIVALHHIDVPWRPSDMEQRNGRGIRQGNLITEEFYDNQLPVYYYATEYTLDAYKYQLLDTKQQFIDQSKTTDGKVREISEGDGDEENGVSFATMTAVISGNPVLLEKAKIDKKVKELDSAEKAFSQEKYTVQDKIGRSSKNLEDVGKVIEKQEQDLKLFEKNSTRNEKTGEWNYVAEIGGTEFTERKLAGEALLKDKSNYIAEMIKAHPVLKTKMQIAQFVPNGKKIIGHIAGFDIVIQTDYSFVPDGKSYYYDFTPSIYVENPNNGSKQPAVKSDDPIYLGSFAHRQLREITNDIEKSVREKNAYEKDIADKEKYLSDLPDEFPKAKEYEEALATQKQIDQTLSEMATESAKALPTEDVIEADGVRIRDVNEVMDLINEGWDDEIYAISDKGDVQKITSYDDIDTAEEGSKFYRYDADAKSVDDEIKDAKKNIDDLEDDNSDAGELGMNNIVTKKRVKLAAAYTKLAYLYIKKGMSKLSDFIKSVGDKTHDFIVDAWNNAKEKYTKERIAKAFDDAKIKNKLFGIMPPFNLFPAIWNGTMDFAKKAILAGGRTKPEINKAILDAMKHAQAELKAAGGPDMTPSDEKIFKARMRATLLRVSNTPSFAMPNQPISDAEKKVAQEMFNQMLNPKEKPSTLIAKTKDFFSNLSKHLDNPYVYVTKLEDGIFKQYPNTTRTSRVPLGRIFEQSYIGPAKLAVEDFRDEVLKGLSNTELQSLHEYIAARRVIDRLKDVDNEKETGNITIQLALAQLENIQNRLSPLQYQTIVDRGEAFQKHADGIMLELYEGGLISLDTLNKVMDSKDFYAPFSVVQNIFTNLTKKADGKASSAILYKIKGISRNPIEFTLNDLKKLQDGVAHKIITQDEFYRGAQELLDGMYQSGSLTEEQYTNESIKLADPGFAVNNIFDRMAEMIYKSRVLGERNKTMGRIDALRQVDTDGHFFKDVEGFELRHDAHGQPFMFPKDLDRIKAPEGFAPIQYKIDGKTKFVAINEEAAKALRGINEFEMKGVMKLINFANKAARVGIITYSPSFLFANSVIDNYRSLTMSKYGAVAGKDIFDKTINAAILIPQMMEALWSGLAANFAGYRTPQYEAWMKSKSFSRGVFDDIFNDSNHKITSEINMTTPQQILSGIKYILTVVPRLGVSLEQMTKLYTFTRGMDVEGVERIGFAKWAKETVLKLDTLDVKSGDELAAVLDEIAFDTLNRSGSPNFSAAGNWAKYMSGLFQFFSARLKGEFSDWRILTNTEGGKLGINKNKVASGLAMGILKIGMYALLPMMYAAIKNLWNDDDEKAIDTITNSDKNNNVMVGTDAKFNYEGETYRDYIKVPLRGVPATANTLVINYMDWLKKDNPEAFKNVAIQAFSNTTPINLNLNYKEGDDITAKTEKFGNAVMANTNPAIKFTYEELRNVDSYTGYPLVNNRIAKSYFMGNESIMPWEVKLKNGTEMAQNVSKAIYNGTGVKVTAAYIDHMHKTLFGGVLNQLDSNALSKRIYRSEETHPIKK